MMGLAYSTIDSQNIRPCRRRDDPPCGNDQRAGSDAPIVDGARRVTDRSPSIVNGMHAVQAIAEHVTETGSLPDEATMRQARRLVENHNHIANVLGHREPT